MTSNEHLQVLLHVRRALLREVARLDVAITSERDQVAARRSDRAGWQCDVISWEDALHRAKIPGPHERPALHS